MKNARVFSKMEKAGVDFMHALNGTNSSTIAVVEAKIQSNDGLVSDKY